MHQHPRPSPRSATPASNPTTNPERTNNPRDQPPSRTRSSVDLASYTERAGGDSAGMAGRNDSIAGGSQDRESTKLNQIIQHFHTKAALTICSARANLPQVYTKNGEIRQNRWFNIILDETDVLLDDLQEWKRPNLYEDRPLPLVIEVVLDTANLTNNQALVLVDDTGKRWDVSDALASSADSSPRPTKNGGRHCEVVLERWTVELGDPSGFTPAELNDLLPNVYKKGVVLFRSLYTFLRFLPAWKLFRKLGRQAGGQNSLRLSYRIRQEQGLASGQKDTLVTPLCPSERDADDIIEHHSFTPLVTPAGPLHCSVDYRKHCSFGVADSESLLSSHFLGLDAVPTIPAGRSLPSDRTQQPRQRYSSTAVPTAATTRDRPRGLLGAYGSLGTFHAPGKRESPVSELKHRAEEEDESEDEMLRLQKLREEARDYSRQEGSSAVGEGRQGIIGPAFKGGSLKSSPRHTPSPRPSPVAPSPIEVAVTSPGPSSPKPAPGRFSSSFANRNKRYSSQGNKTGESATSSGRGSSDSKEKSGQLGAGTPGSSRSGKTDEENIASFISDIEKSKNIRFHTPPAVGGGHIVNIKKYSDLKEGSTALAEDMSSSQQLFPSSTPPSRRLSNVPGLSTSSSPSRALAHAPHVRSRLSTHSIVEEGTTEATASSSESPQIHGHEEDEEDEPFIFPSDRVY